MKHTSRSRVFVGVLAVCAVWLPACGDDDGTAATTAPASNTSASAADTASAAASSTSAAEAATSAAPSSTSIAAVTTTAAPLSRISMKIAIVSTNGIDTAALLVGQDKGIFDECGIDVSTEAFTSGPDVLRATTSGATDLSVAGVSTPITAFVAGEAVSVVSGAYLNSAHIAIVVPPDSPLQSVADLAGKKVGVPSPLGPTAQQFRYVIEQEGVDPNSVEFVVVGALQAGLAAMAAGQVDATYVGDPILAEQVKQNNVRVLASVDDYLEVQLGVYVGSTAWVTEHAEDVDRYLACLQKAQQYIVDNVEEAAKSYAKTGGLDEAAALDAITYAVSKNAYTLKFSQPSLDFTLDQLKAVDQLPDDYAKAQLDPLFVNLRDFS